MSKKPKIRHLAIITRDPEKLAKFYGEVFEMEVLHRSETGAVYMTDGYMNVALLRQKMQDTPNGLNHFGWEIEDTAAMGEKLNGFGIPAPTTRPANRPYAEHRAMDVDGNLFDLSEHGFNRVEYKADRDARTPEKKKEMATT